MRDNVFSKLIFSAKSLFLIAVSALCALQATDVNAASSAVYSFNSMTSKLSTCDNGTVVIGSFNENPERWAQITFTDDLELKCDLEIYDNMDFNLNGHELKVIDGHKIIVKQGFRVYSGTTFNATIETADGADLVFGNGYHHNLNVFAGADYGRAIELNDLNEVYLQGGYYYDSTFYVSQNTSMDIDGSNFFSTGTVEEAASIVVSLDERSDSGAEVDAFLNIEAAYFNLSNADCDEASIKIVAPDMPNNNSHILATIEYANFEGQNAIVTDMEANRTGDVLDILDGQSSLDGSFIVAKGNGSDPALSILDGEFLTKASFYGDPTICQTATEIEAATITSGIFSDSKNIKPAEGYTLLPLENRDYDMDGTNDVIVKRGIDTATVELSLEEGQELELDILNLDGEEISEDDLELSCSNNKVSINGLKIKAIEAGKSELTLKYGTQEKKYLVEIIAKEEDPESREEDKPGTGEDSGFEENGTSDVDSSAPLTQDTITSLKTVLSATVITAVVLATVFRRCCLRKIEK